MTENVTPGEIKPQIKIVTRIVNAGDGRKVITIPSRDLPKVKQLEGVPVIVTLQPVLL